MLATIKEKFQKGQKLGKLNYLQRKVEQMQSQFLLAINTYKQKKLQQLILKKIIAIEKVTNAPLVLHGGSGISNAIRKKLARNHSVAKLNIGTELRMLFGLAVRKNALKNKKKYDRLELLQPTIKEMKKLTKRIISNIGPSIDN